MSDMKEESKNVSASTAGGSGGSSDSPGNSWTGHVGKGAHKTFYFNPTITDQKAVFLEELIHGWQIFICGLLLHPNVLDRTSLLQRAIRVTLGKQLGIIIDGVLLHPNMLR